ncbi:MAG: hypothetical protein HZB71_11555 [Betaproteobacteria bacterium]|nr:hypothetical protein [Betaproteobacteria bacterium]
MDPTTNRSIKTGALFRESGMSGGDASGELAHLMAGLERQKEELGPIAEELLELLHQVGVPETRPRGRINPSNG